MEKSQDLVIRILNRLSNPLFRVKLGLDNRTLERYPSFVLNENFDHEYDGEENKGEEAEKRKRSLPPSSPTPMFSRQTYLNYKILALTNQEHVTHLVNYKDEWLYIFTLDRLLIWDLATGTWILKTLLPERFIHLKKIDVLEKGLVIAYKDDL